MSPIPFWWVASSLSLSTCFRLYGVPFCRQHLCVRVICKKSSNEFVCLCRVEWHLCIYLLVSIHPLTHNLCLFFLFVFAMPWKREFQLSTGKISENQTSATCKSGSPCLEFNSSSIHSQKWEINKNTAQHKCLENGLNRPQTDFEKWKRCYCKMKIDKIAWMFVCCTCDTYRPIGFISSKLQTT